MEGFPQLKKKSWLLHFSKGDSCRLFGRLRTLFLFVVSIAFSVTGYGADFTAPYGELLDRKLDGNTNSAVTVAPDLQKGTAAEWNTYDLETAIKADVQKRCQDPHPDYSPSAGDSSNGIALGVGIGFLAVLGLVKFVQVLDRRFNSWPELSERLKFEELDSSLAAFFEELHSGMQAPLTGLSHPELHPASGSESSAALPDSLDAVFEAARKRIFLLHAFLVEIRRESDVNAQQGRLVEFFRQAGQLKEMLKAPEMRPVWLVACALEGLIKQLSNPLSTVTPSVLAVAAGAVDLLKTLCVRGVRADLASQPPIRLLAVDDDPVSRMAISFALKKAFSEPDLAPEGQTGLALAAQRNYDVIFLDVEMPGMDGFEVCKKVHETEMNRTTPVVFVTRHSDFDSRVKSSLSGGQHLIGKPFLSFEITVKALTLALAARLKKTGDQPFSEGEHVRAEEQTDTSVATHSEETEPDIEFELTTPDFEKENDIDALAFARTEVLEFRSEFMSQASARFEDLQNLCEAARCSSQPANLRERLAELMLGVHGLRRDAEQAGLRTVHKLSSTLEGLLKKLVSDPEIYSPSLLKSVTAAVEVLAELCSRADSDAEIVVDKSARILVVDDDPIALRAISGAVQLAFARPRTAYSGEAAIELSSNTRFDLVFLDVCMPGMDGFTACAKIHKTTLNGQTPVVFVSTQTDDDACAQSEVVGGAGYIPKPVLAHQIMLTALTFIVRARLDQLPPISTLSKTSPSELVTDDNRATAATSDTNGSISQNGRAAQTVAAVTTPAPEPEKIDEATLLLEREFLALIFKELEVLRRRTIEIFETPDNESRFQMLADFYLDFRELMPKACPSPFHPALRLCARLEALLKKLVEQPSHCSSSTLLTIHTTLEVVGELCAPEVQPSLAVQIPIRLLVVDDDPVARRAITGALQLAFEKPECAENGETAVTLASEKPFDAVFMDIEMPGMDGFNACVRIHSTPHNWNTPVVFVTGHSDFKSRTHAAASGGSDFIGKPFLTAEVTLKALTYAMRGRLQKQKFAESGVQFPNGADARTQKAHEAKDRRRSSRKSSKHRKSKSSKAKMARH